MAITAKRMTGLHIERAAQKPGRHGVGDGLMLQVRAPGKASWLWRFQFDGRRRDMGFGPWPEVPLTKARERLFAAKQVLAEGRDPLAVRATVSRPTDAPFDEMAAAYIESHRAGWKAKADAAWRATLGTYASPVIGTLACRDVTTDHVLSILKPIWSVKNATAVKLRRRIEAVLDFAKARGMRDGENVARWRGHLVLMLPKPARVHTTTHRAAVPHQKLPAVIAKLAKARGISALAVRFAALTAQRATAVSHATWAEIDLRTATWTVPVARSKTGRALRIALSPQAKAVLREAAQHRQPNGLVFPGQVQDRPVSLTALVKTLRLAGGGDGTTHGLRAAFKTWAASTGESREFTEHALGHVVGSVVERSYVLSDFLDERRDLMARWGAFVCGHGKAATKGRR
jgi:integrase